MAWNVNVDVVAVVVDPSAGPLSMIVSGGVESSTYVSPVVEQSDVLPAASVAYAENVVEESFATLTVRPDDANVAADPTATIGPMHNALANSRTVDPGSAVPLICGALLLAGETGSLPVTTGTTGGVVSTARPPPPPRTGGCRR